MSYKARVNARDLKYAGFASKVLRELKRAYRSEEKRVGLRKKDVAEKLGVNPALITRWLNGTTENITLKTISDIAWALDHDIDFTMSSVHEALPAGSNYTLISTDRNRPALVGEAPKAGIERLTASI